MSPFDVLVVLGCRIGTPRPLDPTANSAPGDLARAESRGSAAATRGTSEVDPSGVQGAALRRVRHALALFRAGVAPRILVCGGQRWHGQREADAMGAWLVAHGIDRERVQVEVESTSTWENARFGAAILRAEGLTRVALVTCDWHAPRAVKRFEDEGIPAVAMPCASAPVPLGTALFRVLRERTSSWLDAQRARSILPIAAVALLGLGPGACDAVKKPPPGAGPSLLSPPSASLASASPSALSARIASLASAEVTRQAAGIKDADLSDRDVRVRRAAARALSRIGEPAPEKRAASAAGAAGSATVSTPMPTSPAAPPTGGSRPPDENQLVMLAGLKKLLADEDPEVVAFAAYGLGWTCRGREDEHVRALVARAFGLAATAATRPTGASNALVLSSPTVMGASSSPAGASSTSKGASSSGASNNETSSSPGNTASHATAVASAGAAVSGPMGRTDAHALGTLDPVLAIARALGRCASVDAERTLLAWLTQAESDPQRASSAALGLGDLATRRRPSDETLVALTQAASSSATHPLDDALFPFTRIDPGSPALVTRVREVALERLATGTNGLAAQTGQTGQGGASGPSVTVSPLGMSSSTLFAIRALGRTEAAAAPDLKAVLTTPSRDPMWAEKAEAARALGKLGPEGQTALLEALAELAPAPTPAAMLSLVSDAYGPLSVILESLKPPVTAASSTTLRALAALPIPADDPPRPLVTRVVAIRCAAASVVANEKIDDPLLSACDPDPAGSAGQLACLAVLGRKPIAGAAPRELIRTLAGSPSPAVRSAALETVGAHRELPERASLLAAALRSGNAGTVTAAAQQLSGADPMGTDRKGGALVREAMQEALAKTWGVDDIETIAALIDAAGGLYLMAGKEFVQARCDSSSATLREHARRALRRLGVDDPVCPWRAADGADELSHVTTKTRVVLETDAGQLVLQLDPYVAPVATTRLVDLAAAGFFDGMLVHRVVPGFVVQFGDPDGDGFGGAGKPALACETSPIPFEPLSIGVALAGRDTGSSQFFVTLSRTPHLDGDYAWIGKASGDWAAVVAGDRIVKARVE